MELENEVNNNIEIDDKKNFFNNIMVQTIDNAIDIGLKSILPDLIENQIIDIKDALIKNGLKEGIDKAIESIIDFGKSTKGIFTGNFENINQIKIVIGEGGILETISNIIDTASNRAYELGYINKTVNALIKNGKSVLLDNISNNIEKGLEMQTNATIQLEEYIEKWKNNYKNKNFKGMEEEINKINELLNKINPLENVLKESRQIKNIHNLISNNGHNFNITDLEQDVIKKFE